MPQLYTPFAADAAHTIGKGIERRNIGKATEGAYMGDQAAMQDLMRLDPDRGMEVQAYQDKQAQQDLQNQGREDDRRQKFARENKELMDGVMEDMSYFETFEEADAFADQQVEQMRELGIDAPDMKLTPEAFEQIKSLQLRKLGANQETVGSPYPVEDGQGGIKMAVAVRDKKTGQLTEKMLEGARQRVTQHDPNRAGDIAEAKQRGKMGAEIDLADDKAWAELEATAQTELAPARLQAQQTIDVVSQLKNHPGRKWATGVGWLNPLKYAPGTDAHNFMVLADQADGRVFSAAYETLKGGGQITEIESRKASQAIARMETSQSQDEYVRALEDFERAVRDGYDKLLNQATGKAQKDFQEGDMGLTDRSSHGKNNPARPSSQAEYDSLRPGSYYMKAGQVRRKK